MGKTKKDVMAELKAAKIEYDPKATMAELKKLLPKGGVKDEGSEIKEPAKVSNATVERKIDKDELISLQKEGRLEGYNPATDVGIVRKVGLKISFPEGGAEVT